MPTDYEVITEENIKKYGTAINEYGSVLLADLYSDQTHFIYELLQNAEDAEASEVIFRLYQDRLELEHNGRVFNEDDVRGICGLVSGTKKGDLTKIGKFGIGFKSVYAHTRSPEIHSDEEHFTVRDYVRPHSIPPRSSKLGTLFVFPFNHGEKQPKESFIEIGRRLQDLGIRTLLFLKQIDSISYEIGEETGDYLRGTEFDENSGFFRSVTVMGQSIHGDEEEHWFVFEKDITHLVKLEADIPDDRRLTVEIAFQYTAFDSHAMPIVEQLTQSHLTVYFPTEKETHLGFLLQGPYKTTPARDNIPQFDKFNIVLAEQTADLVIEALRWLSNKRWLSVSVLMTMPMELERFRGTLFEPIYDTVLAAITEEDLIPAYESGYVAGKNALLARGVGLRDLLNGMKLQEFFNTDEKIQWVSNEITQDRTPDLRRYLIDQVKVAEIDAEAFARRLTEEFLSKQSDNWVCEFYEFLSEFGSWVRNILKRRPIIRLRDSSHVVAFDIHNKPQAFLPTPQGSRFPTVKTEVCNTERSMEFLQSLGLEEPDVVDEVRTLILSKYRGDEVDTTEHQQDILRIVAALRNASQEKKDGLIRDLQQTPFLLAMNAKQTIRFKRPVEVYLRSSDLEMYFEGSLDSWFLVPDYDPYVPDLVQIGLADQVRYTHRNPNSTWYITLVNQHGWHRRARNGFDPNCSIDGLENALASPNFNRSRFIWEHLLMPHKHWILGVVETSTRQDYSHISASEQASIMGKLVRDSAWVPNNVGEFYKPGELSLEELPEEFTKDEELARQLGMKVTLQVFDAVEDYLRQVGVTGLEEDAKEAIANVLEVASGDPNDLLELSRMADKLKQSRSKRLAETVDYSTSLFDAFNHNGQRQLSDPEPIPKPLKNPNQRSNRKKQEIADSISDEPGKEQRTKLSITRKWEGKDKATRAFLREEYGGRCQICYFTFPRRNGRAYFEAVYIVPYTKGRWLDDPANTLCLCPNHVAQFLYGAIEAPNIIDQIKAYEYGPHHYVVIQLCGHEQKIRFTARHIIDLQAIIEITETS